jgi:hypothetical protein
MQIIIEAEQAGKEEKYSFVYGLYKDVVGKSLLTNNGIVNSESEKVWKEEIVALFEILSKYFYCRD